MSSFRTEKKIASALNAAVQYNLEGMSPTDAVVKAATDKGLNPEMSCRLVEGFNIASSRAFLRSATDKTASFPLADKETVLKKAFYDASINTSPTEEKPDTSFDFWGGSGRSEMKVAESCHEKHAGWGDAPEPAKRSIEDLMEQVRSQKAEHIKFASDARGRMAEAESIILRSIGDVVSTFATSGNTEKFAEFEAEALCELGDDASYVLDLACKHAGLDSLKVPRLDTKNFEKRAFSSLDWPTELGFVETALAARIVHQEVSRKLASAERIHNEQTSVINGYVRKIAGLAEPEEVKPKTAADMLGKPKTAGAISDVIGAGKDVGTSIGGRFPTERPKMLDVAGGAQTGIQKEYENAAIDSFKNKRTRGLGESDEMDLDNMKRQVILQDLLINDEILKTQDPRAVIQAYHALLSINPSATLVPEVARSVLRNSVSSSALDTFTAEQMAKLEQKMRQNRGTSPITPDDK